MKKISSILLVLILMLQTLPAQAARGYRSLWIECDEAASVLSGEWAAAGDGNASGKSALKLDTTKEGPHEVSIGFNLSYEEDYDIYLLGTPGSTDWASVRKWKLDDGEYQSDRSENAGSGYSTADARVAGISWFKFQTVRLSKGSHTLSFYVDQLRTMGNDMYYSILDVIAIVPASWGWTPDRISVKPYNKKDLKINIASGQALKKELKQEENFTVEVQYRLGEKTDGSPRLYAELSLNGETVSRDSHLPSASLKTWGVGLPQTETFSITVPFNAPDGQYEIRAGVEGVTLEDGNSDLLVDQVVIGDPNKPEVVPVESEFSNVQIPEKIEKNVPVTVSADFKLNREIGKEAKPYLSLWKDGLLYEVLEGTQPVSEENGSFSFTQTLTSDLPAGEYDAQVGIHYVHTASENSQKVSVSGGDSLRTSYHKPMSYGHYYSKQTGREQFWYINQSGTAIWNGEPYIPFGGMFVSNYLWGYSSGDNEGNKQRFEQDVEDLEKIRASGVNDLYINAVSGAKPGWAWKYLLDYMEENGWYYGIQCANLTDGNTTEWYYPHATEQSGRFEVKDVTASGEVTLTADKSFGPYISDTRSAVYVVVNDETKEVSDSGICELVFDPDGQLLFRAKVKVENNQNHTVYFSPKVYSGLGLGVNYWTNPERFYHTLNKFSNSLELGDNMRLFVDPLYNEMGFYNQTENTRIRDDDFNNLFVEWLKNKYQSTSDLNSAWKTEPQTESFEDAVRLIPVYTSEKDENGVSYSLFVDDQTGKVYKVDTKTGSAWQDYLDARDDIFVKVLNKSADSLKNHVDVPVVYKHCSVQRRYFVNKDAVGGFEGLGSETYGQTGKMPRAAAMTASLTEQMTRTGWPIITETNTEENVQGKYDSGEWSYPSEEDMVERFQSMLDGGTKGIYDFLLQDRPDAGGILGAAYSWINNPDTITWAGHFNENLEENIQKYANQSTKEDKFYFFPPQTNWWFTPTERTAVQNGDDMLKIALLRTKEGTGNHISQTNSLDVDTRLLFINLQDGPYSNLYGPQVSKLLQNQPADKRVCVIGHRNDLGTIPEIDRYFTDEKVVIDESTGETVQILKPTATSEVLMQTADGKPWALRDGELYIISSDQMVVVGETGYLKYIDELGVTDVKALKGAKGSAETAEDGFSDMKGHWAEQDVNDMKKKGFAAGVGENRFDPESSVSVAEFVALITRAMGYTGGEDGEKWYQKSMEQAEQNGLLTETMKQNPEKSITREEMAYAISKAAGIQAEFDLAGYSDAAEIDETMQDAVKAASANKIIYGMPDGTFRPKENATRAQAVVMIKRLLSVTEG